MIIHDHPISSTMVLIAAMEPSTHSNESGPGELSSSPSGACDLLPQCFDRYALWYCVGCSPFCQRQESSLYAGVLSRQHKINFCWNSKGIGQDGDDGKPEAKPDRAVKLHCNKDIQNGPSLSSNINCWHYPRTKMTTLLDTACVKWYLFYFNVSLFSS